MRWKLTPADCSYAEPLRKRKKRIRTSEQFEAMETRLQEMENYLKMNAPNAPLRSVETPESRSDAAVSKDQEASNNQYSPLASAENATTQHAIEQGELG